MSGLVSILMPVYNTARYLTVAIDSILNQTYRNFELIIINDGSKDHSLVILENFAKKDPRIKLFSRENRGISVTRNELLLFAQGKYIAWMDSDDISYQSRLEKQVNYLESNQDCVAVGCMTEFIDDQGLKICIWKTPLTHSVIDASHIRGKGGAIIFPSSMMRAAPIKGLFLFDEKLTGAEDLDLFLRMAEVGRIENISEVLFLYRQHITSISHAAKLKILHDTQEVIDEARKRRGMEAYICLGEKKHAKVCDIYIKWGWWALNGKNIVTARKYSKKLLLSNPFNWEAWKLMACCIRGS